LAPFAASTGLEPAASGSTVRRSIRLSYDATGVAGYAEELERPAVLGVCALSAFPHGTPVDQAGTGRRRWKQTASSLVAVAGLDPAQTGVMSAALSRLSYTAGCEGWTTGQRAGFASRS
jgi:hypothetical protein